MPPELRTALAAVVLSVAVLGVHSLRRGEGDPRVLFEVGATQPRAPFVETLDFPVLEGSGGYDGQFYLVIATDPLLRTRETLPFIDAPAYRYRRILLPALAAAMCGGTGALCVGWSIPIVLLVAVALGAWALSAFATDHQRSRWWGLAFLGLPSIALGLPRMLPDVLGTALVVVALLYFQRRRLGLVLFALCLAALARESTALVGVALAVHSLRARAPRAWSLGLAALPCVLPILWSLYVRSRIAAPDDDSAQQLGLPFFGIAHFLGETLSASSLASQPANVFYGLMSFAALLLSASVCISRLDARGKDPLALVGLAYAVLALFLSHAIWVSFIGFARALDAIHLAALMIALRRGGRREATGFTIGGGVSIVKTVGRAFSG